MRSIINYLGTQDFPRLRIGIGPVPDGMRGVDYVLGDPGAKTNGRAYKRRWKPPLRRR